MSNPRESVLSIIVGMKGVGRAGTPNDRFDMVDDGYQGGKYDMADPNDRFSKGGIEDKSVIKSVFCSYRGILIVYDVHGNKVHELSGQITYEKYKEIESRSREGITEYDGLDDYKCYACDLKKEDEAWDNKFDPFDKPIKGNPYSAPKVSSQIIQNSASAPPQPVVGDIFFDTVNQCYSAWTGNEWIDITTTTIGQVINQQQQNQVAARNQQAATSPPPDTNENDPLTKILNNIKKPNL